MVDYLSKVTDEDAKKHLNQWHWDRRKQMLAKYPQIKSLMGVNRASALWYFGFMAIYVAVPVYCAHYTSFFAGHMIIATINSFLMSGMLIFVHEFSHNLVFKTPIYNKLALWFGCIISIYQPQRFKLDHMIHHAYLEDVQNNPEFEGEQFFASSWYRNVWSKTWHKAITQLPFFLPFDVLLFHLYYSKEALGGEGSKVKRAVYESEALWLNSAAYTRYAFFLAYGAIFGFMAWYYLILGEIMLTNRFHPFISSRQAEHLTMVDGQPSYSMYGWQNRFTFNVGHHVEHHDFPNIPWNNLPALRAMCPDFYDNLYYHTSWLYVNWRWLIGDPKYQEDNYLGYLWRHKKQVQVDALDADSKQKQQ